MHVAVTAKCPIRFAPDRLRAGGEDDVAAVVQAEAGVVGDLPRMSVEIPEGPRVPSVEGLGGLTGDVRSVLACLLDHLVYLVAGTDVVGQSDPAPVRTVVGDAHVGAQLFAGP